MSESVVQRTFCRTNKYGFVIHFCQDLLGSPELILTLICLPNYHSTTPVLHYLARGPILTSRPPPGGPSTVVRSKEARIFFGSSEKRDSASERSIARAAPFSIDYLHKVSPFAIDFGVAHTHEPSCNAGLSPGASRSLCHMSVSHYPCQ